MSIARGRRWSISRWRGHGTHQLRLLLAQACATLADAPGAHRALDSVLTDEPTNLYALILRGDVYASAADDRAAVSWYQAALLHVPRAGTLAPDLIEALRRVEAAVSRAGDTLRPRLEASLSAHGISATATSLRFAEALDLAGRARIQLQQPTSSIIRSSRSARFSSARSLPGGRTRSGGAGDPCRAGTCDGGRGGAHTVCRARA